MKRKFLEDMGLEKDQIEAIIKENDYDIETAKEQLNQLESKLEQTNEQLQEANNTIEGFKDYDQVKNQVEEYKTKYEQSKAEYETKIEDMKFNSSIEKTISEAGGRNARAIMALLDIDNLKQSKDQSADVKAAIETCKKENSYLFGANEPINNPIAQTRSEGTGKIDSNTVSLRAAMGLPAETTK